MPVTTAEAINAKDIKQAETAITKLEKELEEISIDIKSERDALKALRDKFEKEELEIKEKIKSLGQNHLESQLEITKIAKLICGYNKASENV